MSLSGWVRDAITNGFGSPRPEKLKIENDDWKIVDSLGSGGEGQVYHVHNQRTNTDRAAKVSHSDQSDFATEAAIAGGTEKRNIAKVEGPYTCTTHLGKRDALLMDIYEGDLRSQLKKFGRMDSDKTAAYLVQMAHGLEDAGVVHSDIKPANVLVKNDTPFITDWSAAKSVGEKIENGKNHLHTPAYVAPEAIGSYEASPKQDVFCLGVTAYEMITKRDSRPLGYIHHALNGKEADEAVYGVIENTSVKTSIRGQPYMSAVLAEATEHQVKNRSTLNDLKANLSVFPSVRQHMTKNDWEKAAESVIARQDHPTKAPNPLLDLGATRAILESGKVGNDLREEMQFIHDDIMATQPMLERQLPTSQPERCPRSLQKAMTVRDRDALESLDEMVKNHEKGHPIAKQVQALCDRDPHHKHDSLGILSVLASDDKVPHKLWELAQKELSQEIQDEQKRITTTRQNGEVPRIKGPER